ncbi:MAG TPA: arginase family protein, partial [Streptomyces sp.]|nr:arginase family protein [Streptomyces sp.]
WWLHIDLDVLSTEALPAVDYPQPGGLNWSQLELLTTTALRAPGCLGITLCIYNPDLDPGLQHARRIADYAGRLHEAPKNVPLGPAREGRPWNRPAAS